MWGYTVLMMPWGHAVIGYVLYSLFVHVAYRDSLTGKETVIVVFASVVPDLIDKPLGWHFGVFGGGSALGHSIFFAVPLSTVVFVLAYYRGRPRFGWVFGIGYLMHLPADVFPPYFQEGDLSIERILWPIYIRGASDQHLVDGFLSDFASYVEALIALEAPGYVLAVLALHVFSILLWIYDGMPVARELYLDLRKRL